MRKVILIGLISINFISSVWAATPDEENTKKMTQAYQEGLQAAAEGVKNEQIWAKGEGNPNMAKAYQQGTASN